MSQIPAGGGGYDLRIICHYRRGDH